MLNNLKANISNTQDQSLSYNESVLMHILSKFQTLSYNRQSCDITNIKDKASHDRKQVVKQTSLCAMLVSTGFSWFSTSPESQIRSVTLTWSCHLQSHLGIYLLIFLLLCYYKVCQLWLSFQMLLLNMPKKSGLCTSARNQFVNLIAFLKDCFNHFALQSWWYTETKADYIGCIVQVRKIM